MGKKSEMSRESWAVELCSHAGRYSLWYPGLSPGVQVVLMPLESQQFAY